MAAPEAPAAGGSLLPKDPKRRRMLLALGGAAVLALIFLLQRGQAPAEPQPEEQLSYGPDPAAVPPGSTFADNGEAAGQLSTAISGGLGDVAYGLDGVAGQLEGFGTRLSSLEETLREPVEPGAAPVAASTEVAQTGSPAARAVVRRDRLGRTYQDRRSIQTERQEGRTDRFGRTPTERRLARTNPKVKRELRSRLQRERQNDRRPSQPPRRQARPPARRRRRR